MKKSLLLLILPVICVDLSISQELKLNLVTGKSYYHNFTTHANMSQEIQGELSKTEVVYGGRMRFQVKEKTDSLYALKIEFQQLHLSANNVTFKVSADTDKVDSTNVFSLVFKEMVNSPFEASISEHGIVTNIEMDKLFDNLLNLNPDLSRLEKARAIYVLRQSFGEKALKGSIEIFTAIYPKEPVKVGDVWNNKIRLETISGVTMNNRFELLDRDQNKAVIKINSQTVSDKDESFSRMNGEFYRISSSGKMEATYVIDSKTGWILKTEIVQDVKGLNEKKWKEDSAIIIKTPFTFESVVKVDSGKQG